MSNKQEAIAQLDAIDRMLDNSGIAEDYPTEAIYAGLVDNEPQATEAIAFVNELQKLYDQPVAWDTGWRMACDRFKAFVKENWPSNSASSVYALQQDDAPVPIGYLSPAGKNQLKDGPWVKLYRDTNAIANIPVYDTTANVEIKQTLDTATMSDEMRSYIEGMSVSVDVSTSENDAGNRYFGTVTEVMDDQDDKHGVTLLVQDAQPNFTVVNSAAVPKTILDDQPTDSLPKRLNAIADWLIVLAPNNHIDARAVLLDAARIIGTLQNLK
jgi:ribosomal protein L21E